MKIGVFGGSFDPVHLGHVNLVEQMKIKLGLDKVIVIPAHISPFKINAPPKASGAHRFEMLKKAFEGVEGVELSQMELERGGVSYTIDTLKRLNHDDPEARYFLLMSEEALATIDRWKDIEELKSLATLCFALYKEGAHSGTVENFQLVEIAPFPVSSTEIRERLKKGLPVNKFLHPKVLDYIENHLLY